MLGENVEGRSCHRQLRHHPVITYDKTPVIVHSRPRFDSSKEILTFRLVPSCFSVSYRNSDASASEYSCLSNVDCRSDSVDYDPNRPLHLRRGLRRDLCDGKASTKMPFKYSLGRSPLERRQTDPLLQQHIYFANEFIAPSLEDPTEVCLLVQCS